MITKIKTFYASLTPAQKARLWTLLITILSGIAAAGDKITPTPFLPGWFVNAWPMIVAADVAILKLINIFTNPNTPVPNPNSTTPQS